MEHTKILTIVVNNNICNYFRFVDDILLVYDTTTNITAVLNQFNNITTNLQFTMEHETDKQINFLDVTIHRQQNNFEFDIYRKPTTTNHIIPKDLCHPPEHKLSAIRFLTNRMKKYPLSDPKKEKEYNTIQHILQANQYDHTNIYKHANHTSNQYHGTDEHEKKKEPSLLT
jgi:hypothetical protein